MATSFAEAVLAQIFREKQEDGTYVGGPTYYFSKGLGGKIGKIFAIFFTIVTIINTGFIIASLQINSIANGFDGLINIPKWAIGVVCALLTGLVIFGGIRRISDVAKYLVPVMAVLYLLVALICVAVNITALPGVFALVVKSAFGAKAVAGGALGFTMKEAFRYGCARGLFSNEAGQGTSPAMHGSADVEHPAAQGYVAMFGVLADTLVICTSTAFIILCTGAYQDTALTGINLTQSAIGSVIGSVGPYFILFCICMFAWTSCLADIYYGEACIHWIGKENKRLLTIYRLICVALLVGGAVINADVMWELADFGNALMIFPNVIALLFLSPLVFKAAKDYERQKKEGTPIPKWDYTQSLEELKRK